MALFLFLFMRDESPDDVLDVCEHWVMGVSLVDFWWEWEPQR
jgi:hypothetical protein